MKQNPSSPSCSRNASSSREAQPALDTKIQTLPLLATLTLESALVTADAIHAREQTAQLVLDRGGDYLFALKANRPAMQEAIAAFFFDPPEPLAVFETIDGDHGRIETRYRTTYCIDWLFGERTEPSAPVMPGSPA